MGFWLVVIVSIVLVFVWGLFSPRSQWKVLAAWSYRDPRSDEPSAFAFGVQRALSAIGIFFFGAIGVAGVGEFIAAIPPAPPTLTALQQMWGVTPVPQVVDRIVQPASVPPPGLVDRPIDGYQAVDNAQHKPRYLHLLDHFAPAGTSGTAGRSGTTGYIGTPPGRDFSALDSAELVVNVRAWFGCIPRQAVILETETTVQIAVYYGLPDRADGTPPDHASCSRPPFVQSSLLLPINLSAPLGERELQSLDGTPIREVKEIVK